MNIVKPSILSLYFIKEIFKKFLFLYIGLFILFFSIDFLENINDVSKIQNGFLIVLKISLYKTPIFLEKIMHFILLLSSLFTFYKMSNNSEITIMQLTGKPLISILKFPLFFSYLLGWIIVLFYFPFAGKLNEESTRLYLMYLKNEKIDLLEPKNGFWFVQNSLSEKNKKIIINAKQIYKNTYTFNDVILLYMNNDFFEKRINSKKLIYNNKVFTAYDNYIISPNNNIEYVKEITIPTNVSRYFLKNLIKNRYESVENISFLQLKRVKKRLDLLGFNTKKYDIRFYFLLTLPLLYVIMIIISLYFGIVNFRDNIKYINIIKGIIMGFCIYITHNIIYQLTEAEKLSITDGCVLIILFYLLLSILLLIKKDILQNM